MNANEVLAGNEEHSYPETITVSYGDNNFGAKNRIKRFTRFI
mgnify:CR=1 FL=1